MQAYRRALHLLCVQDLVFGGIPIVKQCELTSSAVGRVDQDRSAQIRRHLRRILGERHDRINQNLFGLRNLQTLEVILRNLGIVFRPNIQRIDDDKSEFLALNRQKPLERLTRPILPTYFLPQKKEGVYTGGAPLGGGGYPVVSCRRLNVAGGLLSLKAYSCQRQISTHF